jgi:hypothetical protein
MVEQQAKSKTSTKLAFNITHRDTALAILLFEQ